MPNSNPTEKFCQRCVLSDRFPGISIGEDGICSFCATAPTASEIQEARAGLYKELEAFLSKPGSTGDYDCIVAFSGGKDSSFTLKLLSQDFKKRCLAITIDNGFISEQAKVNCRTVTQNLGVDFMEFAPNSRFMRNMYQKSVNSDDLHSRAAITRASNVCNSCINLINNTMVKMALQTRTPVIAGGYIAGQVPKDAFLLDLDLKNQARFRKARQAKLSSVLGPDSSRYFDLSESLLESGQSRVTIINPMLAVSITEDEIVDSLKDLGWEKTKDTGLHSTNCRLNDLGIHFHYKKNGFHPYAAEIAEQVRCGVLDREKGLEKIKAIPTFEQVKTQAEQIGVGANE